MAQDLLPCRSPECDALLALGMVGCLSCGALQSGHYDRVDSPEHYTAHPSGVECIQVAEHMNFCLGNAMKYIWRAGLKGNAAEDLEKAIWYLKRELVRETTP